MRGKGLFSAAVLRGVYVVCCGGRESGAAGLKNPQQPRDAEVDERGLPLYRGPSLLPPCQYRRLYDPDGPIQLRYPPLNGGRYHRAELRPWPREAEKIISQNSSKRKVHRACWLSPLDPSCSFPVAVKFVEDSNVRDGRSIKREIECHLYIYQRLGQLQQLKPYARQGDAWPCAELLGYYLDKKNPGQSVLITRKLSGPDFFDVIRTEHSSAFNPRTAAVYEQHKLHWCYLAMERISQYARLGIRHNDIKPDNIVLDFFTSPDSSERLLDVKLIDLGTASMHSAKDFTGGTSWYESPEQKMLEYHTKKERNLEVARQVAIGLPSDAWGAGLSITEVLMGRRVVDVLRAPGGPGPLEYRGKDEWAVHPKTWVSCAREALGLDREQQRFPICTEAARVVFDMLVKAEPEERATVEEVLPHLRKFAEAGFLKAMRRYHDDPANVNLHSEGHDAAYSPYPGSTSSCANTGNSNGSLGVPVLGMISEGPRRALHDGGGISGHLGAL
ncbi:uncharacterized protein LOC113147534 [Cyclospora cayetanensis]|uniref:Uncharacterized protein LOC113147534 n=1 Tax=Cyclospora cayetanensis TaxID=88456 RepID=A0A6P6S4F6_9EIME|nr:uncharacterized protein LOC113147534 [Cyclospora cayetanensis]